MSDVVMIVGYPSSGKSSVAKEYIMKGYTHINRDINGGTISNLIPVFNRALIGGKKVILDNTFPTVESRKGFIDVAQKNG